jgi:hypothetical protein
MKDPIVAEARQHRMEHTQQFHSDLALICEEFCKLEAGLGDRLVSPQPRLMRPLYPSPSQRVIESAKGT